jgi:hypothetical protein
VLDTGIALSATGAEGKPEPQCCTGQRAIFLPSCHKVAALHHNVVQRFHVVLTEKGTAMVALDKHCMLDTVLSEMQLHAFATPACLNTRLPRLVNDMLRKQFAEGNCCVVVAPAGHVEALDYVST